MAVRGLVQGVQRQPAPGVGNSGVEVTLRGVVIGQAHQRVRQVIAQPFGLEELPVVEVSAVAQGETAQEVVSVQLRRLFQKRHAIGTGLGGRMLVRLRGCEPLAELDNVDPHIRVGVGDDRLAVRHQPLAAQRPSDRREVAAQTRPSAARLQLRPEQRDQRFAAVSLARDRQVGDER